MEFGYTYRQAFAADDLAEAAALFLKRFGQPHKTERLTAIHAKHGATVLLLGLPEEPEEPEEPKQYQS
jgi:hypothetical protein